MQQACYRCRNNNLRVSYEKVIIEKIENSYLRSTNFMHMGIQQDKTRSSQEKYLIPTLVVIETLLVIMAMLPAQIWTRLLPSAANATLNGPFPSSIAPVITILIYLLPTLIGFLNRHWQ